MGSQAFLLWNLVFSSVGIGYFIYGKKQREGMPLLTGILLMVFPFFISNIYALVIVGLALMALPRFISF